MSVDEVVVVADATNRQPCAVGKQPQHIQRVVSRFKCLDLRPHLRRNKQRQRNQSRTSAVQEPGLPSTSFKST
jgi:hypothetical protein